MKVIETIKAHPYITAGGVFVVGLIIVLSLAGGKKQVATPISYSTPTADGSALQAAQVSAQAQVAIAQAQASAMNNQTAAAVTLGTLQAQQQGQLGAAQIAAVQETTDRYNTLNAQVENARIQAAQNTAFATNAASVTLGQYSAQTAVILSDNALSGQLAGYSRDTYNATMSAQTAALQSHDALAAVLDTNARNYAATIDTNANATLQNLANNRTALAITQSNNQANQNMAAATNATAIVLNANNNQGQLQANILKNQDSLGRTILANQVALDLNRDTLNSAKGYKV